MNLTIQDDNNKHDEDVYERNDKYDYDYDCENRNAVK